MYCFANVWGKLYRREEHGRRQSFDPTWLSLYLSTICWGARSTYRNTNSPRTMAIMGLKVDLKSFLLPVLGWVNRNFWFVLVWNFYSIIYALLNIKDSFLGLKVCFCFNCPACLKLCFKVNKIILVNVVSSLIRKALPFLNFLVFSPISKDTFHNM